MRLPTRKSERERTALASTQSSSLLVTKETADRMKQQLQHIEKIDLPAAQELVRTTAEFGDFSENFEYQQAKARLRRLLARQVELTQQLLLLRVIEKPTQTSVVQIGSTVTIALGEHTKTFQIVDSTDASPLKGRLSFHSPLGQALIGKSVGEEGTYASPIGPSSFHIISIS